MPFQKLNDDLNIISKLADEPNDVGGLTAAQLKEKFDAAGNAIKEFINTIFIAQLENSGATNIGIKPIEALPEAVTIQTALENITAQLANVVIGQIPNLSITSEKIVNEAITEPKIAAGSVTEKKLSDHAVTAIKLALAAVSTDALQEGCVTSEKIKAGAVGTTALGDNTITSKKFTAGAVDGNAIRGSSVANKHLQADAVEQRNIKNGAVSEDKLGADVKASFAPMYSYGTWDLNPGTSPLDTGKLYIMYE